MTPGSGGGGASTRVAATDGGGETAATITSGAIAGGGTGMGAAEVVGARNRPSSFRTAAPSSGEGRRPSSARRSKVRSVSANAAAPSFADVSPARARRWGSPGAPMMVMT
ncbi:hypothetical protein AB5I41_22765 [Sphingomonas sp. MMS24-JH45]